MKHTLSVLLATLLAFSCLTSCSKSDHMSATSTLPAGLYYYQIAEIDKDSTAHLTYIQLVRVQAPATSAQIPAFRVEPLAQPADDDPDSTKHCDEHHKKNCSLPVVWNYFKASAEPDYIKLQFQTAVEVLVNHFEVRRSTDGHSFKVIAILSPGKMTYEYKDYLKDL